MVQMFVLSKFELRPQYTRVIRTSNRKKYKSSMFPRGIYTETPPLDESNDGAKLGRKNQKKTISADYSRKTKENKKE